MTRLGTATIVWITAYPLVVGAAVAGIVVARNAIVADLGSPVAQRQWDHWKQDSQHMPDRKPAKADEPPLLILFRDHFAAVMTMGVAVTTLLFGFLSLTLRGSLRSNPTVHPE